MLTSLTLWLAYLCFHQCVSIPILRRHRLYSREASRRDTDSAVISESRFGLDHRGAQARLLSQITVAGRA